VCLLQYCAPALIDFGLVQWQCRHSGISHRSESLGPGSQISKPSPSFVRTLKSHCNPFLSFWRTRVFLDIIHLVFAFHRRLAKQRLESHRLNKSPLAPFRQRSELARTPRSCWPRTASEPKICPEHSWRRSFGDCIRFYTNEFCRPVLPHGLRFSLLNLPLCYRCAFWPPFFGYCPAWRTPA
jgi:hypothetical protein